MRKTYREVIEFINASASYLRQHPAKNKLEYALTKVAKKAMKAYEQYNEKLEDIRIANSATDAEGIVLRDDRGNFRYKKEGLLAVNKGQKALAEETAEIEPFIASESPALSESEKESFEGFVVGPDTKFAEALPEPVTEPA